MDVDVTARGPVSDEAKQLAREKVGALDGRVRAALLHARVVLTQEENPRLERPARAEGELDVDGRMVRGRVAEATMPVAIDQLAEHLERQLRRSIDRLITRRRQPAATPPGEWRHGAFSPERPARVQRPAEERQLVRRKSFAFGPITAAEAAGWLEDLDHDFYLFRDAATGSDAVVFRRDDGALGAIVPAGTPLPEADDDELVWEQSRKSGVTPLEAAVAEMNELDHRFLFFVDEASGRGNVIYLRYDGHYGLIEPAG